MSRIAKKSILIPKEVQIKIDNNKVTVIGIKGTLFKYLNNVVQLSYNNRILKFSVFKNIQKNWMHAGTSRSLVNSMIIGVTNGFLKKLKLIGVGYRASLSNFNNINMIVMSLGYSHDIKYILPKGVNVNISSQTEITVFGIDKQLIGQVAANLRNFRIPDAYKGKGVRYIDEIVKIKEAKKK
ncbi:50S ribosomal protein L6 [Buchnera aphidicola]|uniref:50S ribosomal protein L6 n=1 Tax=Buchnera aphidicola TaxID=9 RepID=UPI0030ED2977